MGNKFISLQSRKRTKKNEKKQETFDPFERTFRTIILELNHLSLLPLVTAQLEVFASFDWFHGDVLLLVLAVGGFHFQDGLFGDFGFLVEDRFSLTTITALFSVVSSSTLAEWRFFAFFVLGHLEVLVLPGGRAVGFSGFWDVYHGEFL